jgi:hypothetical protein
MNDLFDNLKDLKKDLVKSQEEENAKQEKLIKDEKEKKLKSDFEAFMRASGIKKIANDQ